MSEYDEAMQEKLDLLVTLQEVHPDGEKLAGVLNDMGAPETAVLLHMAIQRLASEKTRREAVASALRGAHVALEVVDLERVRRIRAAFDAAERDLVLTRLGE